MAGALPTAEAAGGSFAPGTYFRTAATVYTGSGGATGPNGVTDKQTIVLSDASAGGRVRRAERAIHKNGGADQRGTLMGTPSGTTVSLLITCPASGPFGDFPYTATATSFTLYNTLHNVVEVYTKQWTESPSIAHKAARAKGYASLKSDSDPLGSLNL